MQTLQKILKMKIQRHLFIIILLIFKISASLGQSPNIFESPEILKDFLDKKTYIVPEYGTIRFDLNKSETKKMRELREKDHADDEVADLIFDATIKRNQSRRKDKIGYRIEIKIVLTDPEDMERNVSDNGQMPEYVQEFQLARNILYFIKDFPVFYQLFADGELYFAKIKYKKLPTFSEYKSLVTMPINGPCIKLKGIMQDYATTTYVKCMPTK